MKNNTMIPYNPKKDLETNYYNKTEVELLVAGGSGGSIDLSNYYKKLETYSKAQVDALVAGGGADLSDYYTKAEVDGLLDSISLDDYYTKTQTEVLLSNKVEKEDGKGLSTNDFTNTFKQAYDGHLASTSNPHNVTALQVGAYSKSENDNLLDKKANLDINNKIPLSEIPDSILGQLKYMGVWDFSSGFPTGAEKGNYWITSVSGNGYEVGDWAVYNGTSFDKVDNTDAVSSVAGRTGNVVLNKNDVGLNNVNNTSDLNKPISTATQTALDTKVTKVASTDNAIVRFNGTTGEVQNSGVIISDTNNVGIGAVPTAKLQTGMPVQSAYSSPSNCGYYNKGTDNGYGIGFGTLNAGLEGASFIQTYINDSSTDALPLLISPAGNQTRIGGFTKLGSDAPAIKYKKITGRTASTEGGRNLCTSRDRWK